MGCPGPNSVGLAYYSGPSRVAATWDIPKADTAMIILELQTESRPEFWFTAEIARVSKTALFHKFKYPWAMPGENLRVKIQLLCKDCSKSDLLLSSTLVIP